MTNTGISEQVSLRCIQRFLPHLISSDLSADKVDFNKKVNPCVDSDWPSRAACLCYSLPSMVTALTQMYTSTYPLLNY